MFVCDVFLTVCKLVCLCVVWVLCCGLGAVCAVLHPQYSLGLKEIRPLWIAEPEVRERSSEESPRPENQYYS